MQCWTNNLKIIVLPMKKKTGFIAYLVELYTSSIFEFKNHLLKKN